jgi:hypothetical protein
MPKKLADHVLIKIDVEYGSSAQKEMIQSFLVAIMQALRLGAERWHKENKVVYTISFKGDKND